MFDIITLIISISIVVAVGGVVIYLCAKSKKQKHRKELRIADSPAVVSAIQQIAELTTFCLFEEKIIVERKAKDVVDNRIGNYISSKLKKEDGLISDEICLIAQSQVRAGYRLDKLSSDELYAIEDTLYIKLPQTEILDIIINPRGWDFYVEDGDWTEERVKSIKQKAKQEIRQDALDLGILKKASSIGEKKIKALFLSLGFKNVVFT